MTESRKNGYCFRYPGHDNVDQAMLKETTDTERLQQHSDGVSWTMTGLIRQFRTSVNNLWEGPLYSKLQDHLLSVLLRIHLAPIRELKTWIRKRSSQQSPPTHAWIKLVGSHLLRQAIRIGSLGRSKGIKRELYIQAYKTKSTSNSSCKHRLRPDQRQEPWLTHKMYSRSGSNIKQHGMDVRKHEVNLMKDESYQAMNGSTRN
ncbi:MAG: hypothetical protein J3Q66DRAFT_396951 [Benniella sp.]|nr:MAG: hypothetical protein J3Q66DRAFT_396951 [Benniella sp.]